MITNTNRVLTVKKSLLVSIITIFVLSIIFFIYSANYSNEQLVSNTSSNVHLFNKPIESTISSHNQTQPSGDLEVDVPNNSAFSAEPDDHAHNPQYIVEHSYTSTVSLAEEEQEMMAHIQAKVDLIEETFLQEPIDREWSDSTTSLVYDSVDEYSLDGVDVFDVDCRTTLCRLAIIIDANLPEEKIGEVRGIIPWDAEIYFHTDDIDSDELVMYVAREDHELPAMFEVTEIE